MKLEFTITEYQDGKLSKRTGTEVLEDDGGRENQLINLYPAWSDQLLHGFGGAITESAAYVYAQMAPEQRRELIKTYYSSEQMGYRVVRISLDSCDFTLSHYEADPDASDERFEALSFERMEKYVLPMLRDAQAEAEGDLHIMLSPWSPPAYMKTNGSRNKGGKLKEEFRSRWAEYICRYIEELAKRGFEVELLSIQNEPKATQTWDSCVFTAEEESVFLLEFIRPSLARHDLKHVKLLIWDHNKERAFERAEAVFQADDAAADGIACHWYSGDHFEAMQMLHARYPKARLVLSEACTELSRNRVEDELKYAQKYAHEIIGDLNAGVDTFIDWNILLDEEGGPFHDRRCGCAAPFIYDKQKKKLLPQILQAYLWHFSQFLEPESRRIGLSRYTNQLEATAFKKDNKISVVVLNQTENVYPVYLRIWGQCAKITMPPNSIFSGRIIS